MNWQDIVTWLNNNKAYIILGVLIVYFIFAKKIREYFEKKKLSKQAKQEQPKQTVTSTMTDYLMFDIHDGISGALEKQKEAIQKELDLIQGEGLQIKREEEEFNRDIQQHAQDMSTRKKNLGVRYTLLNKNLEALNKMIEDMKKIENAKGGNSAR